VNSGGEQAFLDGQFTNGQLLNFEVRNLIDHRRPPDSHVRREDRIVIE